MRRMLASRFWIEGALTAVSAFLFLLTLLWRDWIEAVTGYSPDHHNGSAEWLIVAVLLVATLLFGLLARTEWKKHLEGVPQET